jgi:serine/threonine-protein kinase
VAGNDRLAAGLAAAVLDGTAIDWEAAAVATDETSRPIVEELKVLAALADCHRSLRALEPHSWKGPPPLDQWGHLRVIEPVGHGAFGVVYRAWDTRLDREVALKLLPAPAPSSGDTASSIIEEGRLLARVRHPNVVTIYGAEQIDDRIGLWMEFVRGRTLKEQIDDGRAFDEAAVIRIGAALGEAIDAVHHAGLLHRDIKAQNVVEAEDGRIVLMDFGTGRELEAPAASDVAGTPLYLAPEILGGAAATVQSDVYSLGVLLHYLAARSFPVNARSLGDLRDAHAGGQRSDANALRPALSRRLAGMIARATHPEPERRYPTAAAFAAELARLSRPPVVPRAYRAVLAAVVMAAIAAAVVLGWRAPAAPPGSAFEQPIIAVLPLQNQSAEPDSDYFVDALTDEITSDLAVIEGLQVRSRTSAFTFKGKPRNLRDLEEQLGVNLVVEGSVLRVGQRLRVNVQLVEVARDIPLWANTFDRELGDVFAIQDEISRAIANELRLTLGRGQRRYETNVEVYDLYLRARAMVDRRGVPGLEEAAGLFQQAVARDPGFAPAHAGLALSHALMALPVSSTVPFEPFQSIIRRAALRARDLDPLLADAHAALGWMYAREYDWANAERAFKRAIAINPSLTQAYTSYSVSTLQPLGRLDEALRVLQAALDDDPLSLDVQREIGGVHLLAGRYDDAISTFRQINLADPDFPFVATHLGRALTFAGRIPDARSIRGQGGVNLGRFRPEGPGGGPWRVHAYVMSGRRAEAEALAATQATASGQAISSAVLGHNDRAFDALERMAATHAHNVGRVLILPELAGLHGDPRMRALRARFNLPNR